LFITIHITSASRLNCVVSVMAVNVCCSDSVFLLLSSIVLYLHASLFVSEICYWDVINCLTCVEVIVVIGNEHTDCNNDKSVLCCCVIHAACL